MNKQIEEQRLPDNIEEIIRSIMAIIDENPRKTNKVTEELPGLIPEEPFNVSTEIPAQESAGRNHEIFIASLDEPYKANLPIASYESFVKENALTSTPEMLTYQERRDVARKMHMNALLGSSHNYISARDNEAYKFWAMASKFNQMLSFIMYDRIGS